MANGGMEMLFQLYLSGFLASCIALLLWTVLERRSEVASFAPVVVFGGVLTMMGSLVFMQGEADEKLFNLARDMVMQAAVAYLIKLLSQKPKVMIPAAIALGIVYLVYYRNAQTESLFAMQNVHNVARSSPVSNANAIQGSLDPEAELLIIDADHNALQAIDGVVRVEPAFENVASSRAGDFLARVAVVDIRSNSVPQAHQALINAIQKQAEVDENEVILIEPIPTSDAQLQIEIEGPSNREVGVNDPYVKDQWALNAWNYKAFAKTSKALSKQVVAARLFVLDSGIDAQHEDLKDNYQSYESRHDRDGLGHGTHVAGIAAATAHNGLGIAGWLPHEQQVMKVSSIRVIGPFGTATQRSVVQGIIDAANAGASVINLSLGGPSNDKKQRVYEQAVEYAAERGAIVVVAAGNSAVDARRFSPANTPGVITVAALDNGLRQATFSNDISGLDMGIWAPGKDIYSLVPNNGYTMFSGTSMAAPQVAGLLTVAKAIKPQLTTSEAYRLLKRTVQTSPFSSDQPELIDPATFLESL